MFYNFGLILIAFFNTAKIQKTYQKTIFIDFCAFEFFFYLCAS